VNVVVLGGSDPSVTVTVIGNDPAAVGVLRFTVAVPGLVVAADVAVMVIAELGLGSDDGAVYRPLFGSIVPFALPPVTAQVTV
jgi:hypothetical protein